MLDAEKQANDLNTIRQIKEVVDEKSSLDLKQSSDQKDASECHTKEEFSDSTEVSSIRSRQNDMSAGQEKCSIDGCDTADIEEVQRAHSRSIPPEHAEDTNIVDWEGPDDPENPMNWSSLKRWTHIMLVSAANFLSGIASSMFAPGVPALMEEFNSTNTILASFVVTIFVLGLATGPIVFAPLSEIYGRLYMQHLGLVGFLVFTIACGVSSNLNMLIGFRLMQGIFGSVPLTNAGAVIADMVRQEVRGFAMAIFTLGVLLGPVIGPVSGGFLSAAKGWRWVFWVLAMGAGTVSIICFVVWRESYAPILLARKAARLRKSTGNPSLRSKYDKGLSDGDQFKHSIGRAIKILIYSPVVLTLSLYMGLVYAYFYLLFTTLTRVFEENYGFDSSIVGLSYLGVGLGFLVAQVSYARLGDEIMRRMTKKSGSSEMKPEYRLPLCIVGGMLVPIGLFWYGWSVEKRIHWIMPIIGTGVMGMGNCLIFVSIQSYSVDAFELYAASALAANTVVRSIMAAVLPLAAPKLYQALGLGWGNSLLAFLALAIIPVPILLLKHGESIRGWNMERIGSL
ncbi:Efflux pump radE [Lachnellula cervina]|uniref:Efflux pump radE n=1 Tax=Lachnellula cervina TaxID=1316786 RepID=A0A7D8UW84_9HELO|nr:Efflux pump radE [Lachnellula cervina]